ncbi:MAG: type II secretion system F family protein [Helicobacteraceae bacterium]|jgi:general secretion pathway protein F/type IV pilus assembly protein PilC|nr:type II secretion system F family protein [Helicobacteraceae bacterium]
MLYKYRALTPNGTTEKGTIEAGSKAEAIGKLRARNLLYESLTPAEASFFSKILKRRRENIPPSSLARLCRDLSIYLKAGISIVNAIRLASSQYLSDRKLSSFLGTLATFLDEGKSFSVALDTQSVYDVPPFFKQSIKISENGGMLPSVLEELSRFIKDLEGIKKQAKNAMFYPLFIVFVSFLMVFFMITVVVPQITGMFEQLGQELPPITRFVIGFSDFLGSYWLLIVLIVIGAVAFHTAMLRTNYGYRYANNRLILSLPLIGRIVMTTELARFCYMCSVLMRSGVPFVQTIRLAAGVQSNIVLSEIFLKASDRVVEGGRFSVALQSSGFKVDEALIQSIALGEETSELEAILSNLSALYFEENRDRITIFLSLLEPVLMLFVGGLVGFIITAMMLPIFSMSIGV